MKVSHPYSITLHICFDAVLLSTKTHLTRRNFLSRKTQPYRETIFTMKCSLCLENCFYYLPFASVIFSYSATYRTKLLNLFQFLSTQLMLVTFLFLSYHYFSSYLFSCYMHVAVSDSLSTRAATSSAKHKEFKRYTPAS